MVQHVIVCVSCLLSEGSKVLLELREKFLRVYVVREIQKGLLD